MKYLFRFLIPILIIGCNSSHKSAEVIVKNDIQDREFNTILIDKIYYSTGIALSKYSLNPGDEIALPYTQISRFQVSRDYKDHTNVYEVSCPAKKKGVVIKLIDIHLNRMPGGCLLVDFRTEKHEKANR